MRKQYEPNKQNRARPEQKRSDEDQVFSKLFFLFSKGDPLYFEEIQEKTGQPPAFLRRCLRQIAVETEEGKHKKWTLMSVYKF